MRVDRQPKFDRAYGKLTREQRQAVDLSLRQFFANPREPVLHFEKLLPTIHSIRAQGGLRIIMRRIRSDHFALLDVGSHDLQDQYARGRRR